ncbi:MAG: type III pantothenate kinase [Clostridia bacterium]|nr:type III pantothenate kinase [Clostridia bacterium]
MLVTIDVGNTNIVLGVYEKEKLLKSFRVTTGGEKSRDEYGMLFVQLMDYNKFNIEDIDDVIISSVVPPVMYSLERAVKKYLGKAPILVTNASVPGLSVKYDNPKEVGADRLVNAVAAIEKYKSDCIVVDFGTATTFCAIKQNGDYLGGAICPGIKISLDALISRTSKLPRIELAPIGKVIGKTTVESMQSGMLHGYVGQVDYIVRLMREEMGSPNAKVIATGGLSGMISEESSTIDRIEPNLTLDGLRIIYERLKVQP